MEYGLVTRISAVWPISDQSLKSISDPMPMMDQSVPSQKKKKTVVDCAQKKKLECEFPAFVGYLSERGEFFANLYSTSECSSLVSGISCF